MSGIDRRQFLSFLAAGMATPFVVLSAGAGANTTSSLLGYQNKFILDDGRVFSHSIASGDPSPSGVVLWTRISPDVITKGQNLYVQVSLNPEFDQLVFESVVEPHHIKASKDYTISIDTHSYLSADQRYYFRFIYGQVVSRTGRCRTAPDYFMDNQNLKLALVTCQDYTNGYYPAFQLIADDDSIDFVIHLGDFIYETVGDPSFQSLPFSDRRIELPSGSLAAMNLNDYRHLYKIVRSDPKLQRAMEQHTFIITRDDHETANDAYWDYERHTLGAPDHPYTTDVKYGNSAELLNQLMLDSQQAWLEYIPARVAVDTSSTDPHQFLKYYRKIELGNLVDLVMLDGRTYRSSHACGEGQFGQRYVPLGCTNFNSEQQTLLGAEQRDWLLNTVTESNARWKLIGNQTFMGSFAIRLGNKLHPINIDAWDGFNWERTLIARELSQQKIDNLVVVTGDFHSHLASHLKQNYQDPNPFHFDNFFGVEFMTPAITSAGLLDQLSSTDSSLPKQQLAQALSNSAVRLNNPHIRYFNSVSHGYSTLEFKPNHCDWKTYAVDKNTNSNQPEAKLLRHYRKHKAWPWLITQAAFI